MHYLECNFLFFQNMYFPPILGTPNAAITLELTNITILLKDFTKGKLGNPGSRGTQYRSMVVFFGDPWGNHGDPFFIWGDP